MSTWKNWSTACAALARQRVVAFPSIAFAATSVPPVVDALAVQPVRASAVSADWRPSIAAPGASPAGCGARAG
jgi:hypothetical protein